MQLAATSSSREVPKLGKIPEDKMDEATTSVSLAAIG